MKNIKRILSLGLLITSLTVFTACGKTEATANKNEIKIGVVGENNDQWNPVIKKLASEGITVKLVKFSDYAQPNQALADKEIDLNAFQHYAYLNQEVKDKGFKIEAIGETIIAPLGVYSKKVNDIKQIKSGATIAIPSDATNGGRSLKVLESAGLIKVNPKAGYTPSVSDITENKLNIKIKEVEASQTSRLLDDVDASIINGGHAIDAGLNPLKDAIYIEKSSGETKNPYINVIAARSEDKNNSNYKKVVDAFRSEEVAKVIKEVYKGAYEPAWK